MTLLLTAALLMGGAFEARPEPPPELPAFVDVPVLTYWYDPALGGINCAADCSTFGSGMTIEDYHYGVTAACPVEWRGQLLEVDGSGSYWCLDSGGAIGVRWSREWGLHIKIDVLSKEPVALGPWPRWRLADEAI